MRLRRLVCLLPIAIICGHAFAAAPVSDIHQTDEQRVRALLEGDINALRNIIAPDCVYTHGSGRVQSGSDYLALLERGGLRYLAMCYEFPPTVRLQGPDTAVVNGRMRVRAEGRNGPGDERIMAVTAIYARQTSRWRLVSYQSTPAPAAFGFQLLSQQVAVKNACAWPKLTLLPDGTIIAALYDQPSHGLLPGDVSCWASTDGGATWEQRANVTNHEGDRAWFNHALGVAGNGDLIVATSGWDYIDGAKTDRPLVPVVRRSSDEGRTWVESGRFPESPESAEALVPFGTIVRGTDGVLRVAAFSYARNQPPPREDTGYVVASTDDGKSWSIAATIGRPEVNETDILQTPSGRWLAAARNLGTHNGRGAHSIDLYASSDARTWNRHAQLTLPDQHPGDLLALADGRILLTFGDRRGPDFGVNAMVSADDGDSWSAPFRIAGGFASRDSGYPSSVQLDDGTIVTAYYAKSAEDYRGYHMGVVRWRLN